MSRQRLAAPKGRTPQAERNYLQNVLKMPYVSNCWLLDRKVHLEFLYTFPKSCTQQRKGLTALNLDGPGGSKSKIGAAALSANDSGFFSTKDNQRQSNAGQHIAGQHLHIVPSWCNWCPIPMHQILSGSNTQVFRIGLQVPAYLEFVYYFFYDPVNNVLLFANDQTKVVVKNRTRFFRDVVVPRSPFFAIHQGGLNESPNGGGDAGSSTMGSTVGSGTMTGASSNLNLILYGGKWEYDWS
jgi:hypothetical protein